MGGNYILKKYLLIALAALTFSCSNSQIAPAVNFLNEGESISKKQKELIFEACKAVPNNTQFSIALIENGIKTFYGVERKNDTIFTVNNAKRVFETGSITKVFTSTLLADFVVNKKIKLNDSILGFVDDVVINTEEPITFKQLANHTSGLPRLPSNLNLYLVDIKNPYKNYTEENLKYYLKNEISLANKPGDKHVYSNLGASLLGYLLSKKEQVSYEELLKTRIFNKYDMLTSTINRDLVSQVLVKGMDKKGNETPNWDSPILKGSGRVLSSVSDLTKFVLAHFDDENNVLALTREPTFSVKKNKKIGLGWIIMKSKLNEDLYFHNGRTGGYASSLVFNLAKKNSVIILSNFSKKNDKLCFQLLNSLKNK